MRQYREMKKKHPDAILLFRVGDFYEAFGDDAIAASDILGITLTRRVNGKSDSICLSGFPHHALDTYLPKLIRAGKRVAICEQIEDPKIKKTLVKKTNDSENTITTRRNIALITSISSILTEFNYVFNKLSLFEEIRLKTQDIRNLSAILGISPKKAFEECSMQPYPSLFGDEFVC